MLIGLEQLLQHISASKSKADVLAAPAFSMLANEGMAGAFSRQLYNVSNLTGRVLC